MIARILNLDNLLKKRSFFLFGPRATGKSYLIRNDLTEDTTVFNLLNNRIFLQLSKNPEDLEAMIEADGNKKQVVLDEFQRVPELLNEVHRLIEEKGVRFLLTGSSARRLKNSEVNLLAGRARRAELFPLCFDEIKKFDLDQYLLYGGLPPVFLSDEPQEELDAYTDTYLRDEIQREAVVRKLPAFARFLQTSALTCGKTINFSNLASDAGVTVNTIREYYQVLEDTFLGFTLPVWQKKLSTKASAHAKFYYFDLGVKNNLAQINALPKETDLHGDAFEHFIALELRAYLSYRRKRLKLSFWRNIKGAEVDFIVGDDIAIEVKAAAKVQMKHLKNLRLLQKQQACQEYFLISQDPVNMDKEGLKLRYWRDFLKALWADKLF